MMWCSKHHFIFILLIFITHGKKIQKSHEWDLLIFTQHWPITVCLQYEEEVNLLSDHFCTFPPNKDTWTIHGIWPSKLHTEGPAFCNSSMKFDPSVLDPMEKELMSAWPNIQGDRPVTSLWKHEWQKHGTCAVQLESLDSQEKYFRKGLELFNKYNLTALLMQSKIAPSDNGVSDINTIYSSLQTSLGKNPKVNCIIEKESQKPYLFEIRICFDKNLQLVDCDGIKVDENKSNLKMLTNCPGDELIYYPSQMKPVLVDLEQLDEPTRQHVWFDNYLSKWYLDFEFLFSLLKSIQFVQWLTF